MTTTTPYDPIQRAFLSVIREFKDNVRDDEIYRKITQAKTIDDVYAATDKLQAEQTRGGHLRHLSKIGPYLTRLKDYAHAMGVLVQVKPDVLALIWGPIVLLLQWADVLKTSFDAIVDATEQIGLALPEFKQAVTIFGENDRRTMDLLLLFFKDIIGFYSVALQFFRLPRWRYAFEVLWPKYRDKIKVVTRNIEHHSLLLRRDVQFKHIQEEHEARVRALEHYDATDSARRSQEYRGIMTDISPQRYDDNLYWVQSRVCEGTGMWLVRSPVFTEWIDGSDDSTRLLWLQGIPGAGKTFLSSTVIETAMTRATTLFVFLSYNDASKATALSVFHSLILQLTSQDETLQTVLCESSHKNLRNSIDAAYKLMSNLLACAGPVYIIVDGLDEIDELERCKLVRLLMALSEESEVLRVCLSGRPEADLKRMLADQTILTVRVDNENAGSIQAFVNQWTQNWLRERQASTQVASEIQQLLAPLAWKSKGMFLYAKVVLSSIESMDNISEVENELKVLPEDLNAAYERILTRIDNMKPALRDRARKLLGWISCTSSPFTVQEIQRAMAVKLTNQDGKAPLLVELQIDKICGPIVEVVDNYVQFVHFTVKEYISNPRFPNHIDPNESTISLAMCCIAYLCQEDHDRDLLNDEIIKQNVLEGRYVLYDYAAAYWLELVERSMNAIRSGNTLPSDLVNLLETLLEDRRNSEYIGVPEDDHVFPSIEVLKVDRSELYSVLKQAIHFRGEYSTSQHKRQQGATWVNLDPLTISHVSVLIHEAIEILSDCQLDTATHRPHDGCSLGKIQKLYGSQPFKCSFVVCTSLRIGFETRCKRDLHERHHDRPWKCSIPTCEYANGGFLSRRMRDDHLDRYHQENKPPQGVIQLQQPDPDELQPLLFDLVYANDVDSLRTLLPFCNKISREVKKNLILQAAPSGSAALVDLWLPEFDQDESTLSAAAIAAAKHKNMETLDFILERAYAEFSGSLLCSRSLRGCLESDSYEIYNVWKKYVGRQLESKHHRSPSHCASLFLTQEIFGVATGHPEREQMIISLFEDTKILKVAGQVYRGYALINVAQTNCSVAIAKYLLKAGTSVDFRETGYFLTALHHATKKGSAEAAQLVRFLLLCGADPEVMSGRSRKTVREEKGAKGIVKHLGMSWDELIAQTKKEREQVLSQGDLSKEEIIEELAVLV